MKNITIVNDKLIPSLASGWKLKRKQASISLRNSRANKRYDINATTALIVEQCDGAQSVAQIIDHLARQYPEAQDAIGDDIENVLRQLQGDDVISFVPHDRVAIHPIPEPCPPHSRRKLCIGMATFDDYDGVYFSLQAIRLYHPEVLDELEFIVIDNHPDGPCAKALKQLGSHIDHYRYIPYNQARGTAVRDVIFRQANADYVLCMDSHVFLAPGSLQRLIEYFDANPETKDLLQGPLINDNMTQLSSHFEPVWRQGMYGTWGSDPRAQDLDDPPFDIPMQGLGIFACAHAAWPGFNPRFSGFGGEEGYIHEKFRQAGGRTLCLPFLRWLHRFNRPLGTRYEVVWEDRVRNYMIGLDENQLSTDEMVAHFKSHIGEDTTTDTVAVIQAEMTNPLFYFDAIYCICPANNIKHIAASYYPHHIDKRIRPYAVPNGLDNADYSYLSAHRKLIGEAQQCAFNNVLILHSHSPLPIEFDQDTAQQIHDLATQDWSVCAFSSADHGAAPLSELTGVAYAKNSYQALREAIPSAPDELEKGFSDAPFLAHVSKITPYPAFTIALVDPGGEPKIS